MIPLTLAAQCEADAPFVTRVWRDRPMGEVENDAVMVMEADGEAAYSGRDGLFSLVARADDIEGDILLVDPGRNIAERILRAGSKHNTLLVTRMSCWSWWSKFWRQGRTLPFISFPTASISIDQISSGFATRPSVE